MLPLEPLDLEGAGAELVGRALLVVGLLTVGAAGLATGVLVCVGRVCCVGLVVSLVVGLCVAVGLVVAFAGVLPSVVDPGTLVGLAVLFIVGRPVGDDGRIGLTTLSVPKPVGRVR